MKLSRIIFVAAIAGLTACKSHRASPAASTSAAPVVVQYPVITKLVGRHQTVVISAGPNAALYSIQSPAGEVLLANASFEELRDKHPEYFRYIQPLVANDTSLVMSSSAD